MNHDDVKNFIKKECIPEITGISCAQINYDALFVAISGHGTSDGVKCSDGKIIRYSRIRQWFESPNQLKEIPRFFCIDACRVVEKVKGNDVVEKAQGKVAGTNATTIMGTTEGNTVKGGKVSQYLCAELERNFKENEFAGNWMKFGDLYDAAYARIKEETKHDDQPQQLTMTEYDRPVDQIVFRPMSVSRGTSYRAVADGTAQLADDDLKSILDPQVDSKMNLSEYFFVLLNSG
eukprot:244819_1